MSTITHETAPVAAGNGTVPVAVATSLAVTSSTISSASSFSSLPPAPLHLSATPSSSMANDLDVIQDMIDISADRLEGLRTQCATSATLTQQEIRSLESKLVRMFSELLLTKARLNERIPASGLPHTTGSELRQWLRVVGLSQDSLNVCLTRLSTLEQLLEQSDDELKQMLCNNPAYREEEVRRLTKAMQNLRKCRDFLGGSGGGGSGSVGNTSENDASGNGSREPLTTHLFWDSWDRHHHHHRGSVGNIGITASPRTHRMLAKQAKQQQQAAGVGGANSNRQSPSNERSSSHVGDERTSIQGSTLTLTLTPSPPNSPFTPTSACNFNAGVVGGGSGGGSLNGTPQRGKLAGTPPPMKKHQTLLGAGQPLTPTHATQHLQQQLQQSGGGDSNSASLPSLLAGRIKSALGEISDANGSSGGGGVYNNATIPRSRIHTDPSPDSYSSSASSADIYIVESNNNNNNNSNSSSLLQVPRSPCTPIVTLGMGHTISHRFSKVFKMSTCFLCQKQMFFGLKCKECKYRCHKDCEPNVPPSCGLPPEFVDEFKKTLKDQQQHVQSGGGGGFGASAAAAVAQSSVNTSPNLNTLGGKGGRVGGGGRRNMSAASAGGGGGIIGTHPDSSSPGSSCNSSSPSSPALFQLQQQHANNVHGAVGGGVGGGIGVAGSGSVYIAANVMSSSGGGSSSTSSNMLSTPSSFHKNASQFNFPDVTITSNCAQAAGGSTTQTLYSSQSGDAGGMGGDDDYMCSPQDYADGSGGGGAATSSHAADGSGAAPSVTASAVTSSSNTAGTTHANNSAGGGGGGAATTVSIMSSSSSSTHAHAHSQSHPVTVTASMVNTSTGTFYPRKLSSAGVDKRTPFTTELSDTHKSNDSDKTVSLSGSTSASTDSDRTPVRLDSTEDGDSVIWPRQNSLSLKEWDIPYGDLRLLEQIGRGRFGTVHRALWHGDVAVKLLKEDYLDDEHMLEAFKLEVANFKKTRHENLVLFMGACMNPPYLAIVTSLCKGNTLYTYIHARRDKFTINKTTLVAQQISQGMGYLHARGIHHKDLRTKNIFLENGKVIITDFGLFSSTKLLYCDIGLGVPSGWLCYLAPELMRALLPSKPCDEILPFSKASDVYSFGTVWYELLCGEFPFKAQPPEAIIWQVGRGMKQTLANLQTSRDVKDILMLCWSFQADDRPDFAKLLALLERLPKKRLARSPSHPVQLSRSAESVF